jgi:hypothetical protein
MPRPVLLLLLLASAGCGGAAINAWPAAPNPNGCYVTVFDQPQYLGIRDVWNGPARWATLDGLQRTRRNEIRSLQVGPRASVTVFTESDFKGGSTRMTAKTSHPELDSKFSGRIESLELTCEPAPNE